MKKLTNYSLSFSVLMFMACKPLTQQPNGSASLSSLQATGTVYQSHGPDSTVPNQTNYIVKASYTFPQRKTADIEKWIVEKAVAIDFEKGLAVDALRSALIATPYDLSSYLFNHGYLRISKANPVCGTSTPPSENEKVCWFQENGQLILAIGGSVDPARFVNHQLLRALVSLRNDLMRSLQDSSTNQPTVPLMIENHKKLESRILSAYEKDQKQKTGYDQLSFSDEMVDLERTGTLTADTVDLYFGSEVKNKVLASCYPNVFAVFNFKNPVTTLSVDENACASAKKAQADSI